MSILAGKRTPVKSIKLSRGTCFPSISPPISPLLLNFPRARAFSSKSAGREPELPLDPILKIFTTSSSPNYFMPWQNKPQKECTGSGFAISGRRIITNAHVVADQTQIMVRKHGSATKYPAKVVCVGHECDLALLTVNDDNFWEGMPALEFGDIPHLQESVSVIGYPMAGDNISVTRGVISRTDIQQYAHGASNLMCIQIDAAINPGNSGGPCVHDGKVVGVAFQNMSNAENIGFIIPVPIIQHFLKDFNRHGKYVGFCQIGIQCQTLESAHLRKAFKMKPHQSGILINTIMPLSHSAKLLQKHDILMAFDGHPIANDGTVVFRKKERIPLDFLVSSKFVGDKCTLSILRDGQEMELSVELHPIQNLVPAHQYDMQPSYLMHAGLLFIALTQPYLHEFGEDWYNMAPRKLCDQAMNGTMDKEGRQVVVLSQILADEVNLGYQTLSDTILKKFNGQEILNLKHLKQLVQQNEESFLRFDLDEDKVIILDAQESNKSNERILERHRIPALMSGDLSK